MAGYARHAVMPRRSTRTVRANFESPVIWIHAAKRAHYFDAPDDLVVQQRQVSRRCPPRCVVPGANVVNLVLPGKAFVHDVMIQVRKRNGHVPPAFLQSAQWQIATCIGVPWAVNTVLPHRQVIDHLSALVPSDMSTSRSLVPRIRCRPSHSIRHRPLVSRSPNLKQRSGLRERGGQQNRHGSEQNDVVNEGCDGCEAPPST